MLYMFRFCVWYLLDNHDLRNHIHAPHITVKHSMSLVEAYDYYDAYKNNATPTFRFHGLPKATYDKTRNFAAMEQPLLVDGCPVEHIHISLAYCTRPFTTSDVDHYIIKFADVYDVIRPEHVRLCVVDCTSKNPLEWVILST